MLHLTFLVFFPSHRHISVDFLSFMRRAGPFVSYMNILTPLLLRTTYIAQKYWQFSPFVYIMFIVS